MLFVLQILRESRYTLSGLEQVLCIRTTNTEVYIVIHIVE
jgi:hypothetical protein